MLGWRNDQPIVAPVSVLYAILLIVARFHIVWSYHLWHEIPLWHLTLIICCHSLPCTVRTTTVRTIHTYIWLGLAGAVFLLADARKSNILSPWTDNLPFLAGCLLKGILGHMPSFASLSNNNRSLGICPKTEGLGTYASSASLLNTSHTYTQICTYCKYKEDLL